MERDDPNQGHMETSERAAVDVDPTASRNDEEVVLEEQSAAPPPASTADLLQERSTGEQDRGESQSDSLLDSKEADEYRSRWESIQATFVDEPRASVQQADGLVAEVIRRLTEGFAEQRSELESRWERGDEVSTEDLRVSLQHYRAFFQRLLAA